MSNLGEIPGVLNVLLLDSDGKRVAVRYYDSAMKTTAAQMKFEKEVFSKTSRNNARGEAEIALLDNHIVVYKFCADLHFFVTAKVDENEIIVATVLNAFFDAVSLLLRGVVEKRAALENLDLVLLTIDELIDGGIILETDPSNIANRVQMRGVEGSQPITEMSTSQAISCITGQLFKSMN